MSRERAWLLDMLQAAQDIVEISSGLTAEAFVQSKLHHHAILRLLMVLGEAAKHVPAAVRDSHPEIPWRRISGMRDVLIHGYFRVDLPLAWRIVSRDVPALVEHLPPLIGPNPDSAS